MNRLDFEKWLTINYPHLKLVTIKTTVSDAFYIFNHDLGITFEEILKGKKSLSQYREAIRIYLIRNGKNPRSRPSGYTSHLKYLIEYANSLSENNLNYYSKSSIRPLQQKKRYIKKTSKIQKTFIINDLDVEEAYKKVENDPIYGEENKAVKSILNKFSSHESLDEIICKISVIDVTHSTHVGIHKKKFSLVDLAKKIKSIANIDQRLKQGDISLIDEIANINGVNLLSFASKYCACHNQMIYEKDDYYKFDSVVSKTINYRGRNYKIYSSILDEIVKSNKLSNIKLIRKKIDIYFWYSNK